MIISYNIVLSSMSMCEFFQGSWRQRWLAADKDPTMVSGYAIQVRTCVLTGICMYFGTHFTLLSEPCDSLLARSWPAPPSTWCLWTSAPSWPWTYVLDSTCCLFRIYLHIHIYYSSLYFICIIQIICMIYDVRDINVNIRGTLSIEAMTLPSPPFTLFHVPTIFLTLPYFTFALD